MKPFHELTIEEQIELYLKETGSQVVDLNDFVFFAYSKIKGGLVNEY